MEYFLAAKFYELFYDGFKPDTVVRVQCAIQHHLAMQDLLLLCIMCHTIEIGTLFYN